MRKGRTMINAKTPINEIATHNVHTVTQDASLADITKIMYDDGIHHLPVVNGQRPVGIISDRDVKIFTSVGNMESFTAEDVMTPVPYYVKEDTPLAEVVAEMLKMQFGSVLVVNHEDHITGIFTTTDALKTIQKMLA